MINIVFWFYKDLDVCINRLELIKKHNPDKKIYGLYGGPKSDAEIFEKGLSKYLDDFYMHPNEDSHWKWINGDLVIVDWYKDRGKDLSWDSIAIIQWDLLIFDSIENIFPGIKKDEIFLSGNAVLSEETESKLLFTSHPHHIGNCKAYKNLIREKYNYSDNLNYCIFVFQIFPRIFFEKYIELEDIKTGMLEYKIPTYAKILGMKFYEGDIGARLFPDKDRPIISIKREILREFIEDNLSKDCGWRMFHPYFNIWS